MQMATAEADFIFFLPSTILSPVLALTLIILVALFFAPGGIAWSFFNSRRPIPGPPGIVLALAGDRAHRVFAELSATFRAKSLLAFSVGFTRFIISSQPDTAKEILWNPAFADRPVKESAYELLFHRAMGFAPFGEYWRNLRKLSSTHLFSPKRLSESSIVRHSVGVQMVQEISHLMAKNGTVETRKLLHMGSLNNVMWTVFGRTYKFGEGEGEGEELEKLVKEGYELLGMFNWSDHLPIIGWFDLQGVRKRCKILVEKVNLFVGKIIEEHRVVRRSMSRVGLGDFVDVLLDLEAEKLSDSDMVAVLWEMIFRGTDTVAILLEWILARMILHPQVQSKAQAEIDAITGNSPVTCDDITNLPYLQAIVKECLRMHPPGPLLSWARLAIHDVDIGGHFIPAGTTAMVNMWAITHDQPIWPEPYEFKPERFVDENVNIMGTDLRIAPFGAGRRVCPGKTMALATVHLWLAQLLQNFKWIPCDDINGGVDLSECLKLSLEMKKPLICKAVPRF